MPMTQWLIRIVPYLAGGKASATCLKIFVMCPAKVQLPAPLSLLLYFEAQYKFLVTTITISNRNKFVRKQLMEVIGI